MNPSWLARLWQRTGGEGGGGPASSVELDPLLVAGSLLRQARENRGLSLRQLALETRISTPVLEALERGWADRLPEAAYLRTMLPLLERHLDLERGRLRQALRQADPQQGQRQVRSGRLPLVSVQVFSTWQGTALYGALMLLLLYALNLEQRRLAAQGLVALNPVPPLPDSVVRQPPTPGTERLLDFHPELRPLAVAKRGQALAVLRRQQKGEAATPIAPIQATGANGVLRLALTRPSRLQLRLADGQSSTLQLGAGDLMLPLQDPVELTIAPAPEQAASVLWNDAPIASAGPGRYRWARTAISP